LDAHVPQRAGLGELSLNAPHGPDDDAQSPQIARHRRLLLWVVAIGFFMQTLDTTIVNTALPAMAASLFESPLRMQSVVIAYSLTMATLIPASGWLADRYGTRPIFIGAIATFTLGSACCAAAPNLPLLVAARVLQGMGGAMLLPVGRLIVLRAFPRDEFLPAMSLVTIPGLIGPLIGPTLGGWLVEIASWHWIFLINLPVGVLGCIATLTYLRSSRPEQRRPFDVGGYGLLAISMVTLSLALDGLSDLGLRQATVLVLLMFGLATLAAYWLHAARRPDPLFPLALFRINSFSVGLIGNLFARIGSASMPFLLPLLLQVCYGFSPFKAGLMMIPSAAAGILAKRLGTGLIQRNGYRKVLVVNTLLTGAIIASFALLPEQPPLAWLLVQVSFFGLVNSMQFTAMNTVTLKDLNIENSSSGNSLLSMVMMLAMGMGVATAGAFLAGFENLYGTDLKRPLAAFHSTFVGIGILTCASAWVFWQLKHDEPQTGHPKHEAPEL